MMKTKLVLWGTNAQDEKVLIALELRPKDNKVNIFTFPESAATEEFAQQMMQEWRNGTAVTFPEGHTTLERELSVSDSLLPEDLRVERGDIVNRAQTEWHFIVLSSKLNEVYETELGELKQKVTQLSAYSSDVWDDLKGFWNKVQEQVRDRNLFREHANTLRDNTNQLFDTMKGMRAALDAEFQSLSKEAHDGFMATIQGVEERVQNNGRLASIFDELKSIQQKFRDAKLTREHRSSVWERLDAAFKVVKEKRFGSNANSESSAMERLQRRYDGLINAIDKMEKSIDRDEKDLEFQNRKIATTDGQLEAQIRQAKIKMIEERIRSKKEKLTEMNETKVDLEKKMASQRDKDAKRAERSKIEAAKALAKEKIANNIKTAEHARAVDSNKLEAAAAAIGKKVKPATPSVAATAKANVEILEKPATEAVQETVEATTTKETTTSELIDNAVDTAKAVSKTLDSEDAVSSEEE